MKLNTKSIEVKEIEWNKDLELLVEGDIVILSLGSGEINDFNEYHGLAIYVGERLKGTKDEGFDFCRPQANTSDCFVGYHINKENITITGRGEISSKDFFTYGTKQPNFVDLI